MFGNHTLTRLARGTAVAALLAVLTAPAALARQDAWFSYAVSGSADGANAHAFVTDTLAPGGGSAKAHGYRFVTDTLAPGGGIVSSSPGAQGFDWTDAGIGAVSTVGLMLILLGGTRVLSHRHRVVAV